ncbi:MAG: OsmC family protein [Rhizobiaceae bacterium]
MAIKHDFPSRVVWTGNRGTGTSAYEDYDRTWDMAIEGKDTVHCSNDPMLGGDPSKYNPEDMLIAALSSCHMLWYLHLCSVAGVTVTSYEDMPIGIGESEPSGKGKFVEAVLKPKIAITSDSDPEKAISLHNEIHKYCFIARSVNFPVSYKPEVYFTDE